MLIASAPLLGFAQEQLKSGISLENLDRTANPGESFYQFACGGWMKNNPLPAAYSRYGSFDQLAQANNKRINTILAELASKTFTPGSTEQKLSDFYKQAMDSVRRNKDGVKPVMPLINEIEKASNTSALRDIQFKYATFGYGIPLGIGFGADEKNSRMNILNIYQSGLFLGQKEYYLDNDSATAGIRDAYKKHIIRMFQFFGFEKKSATKKMENIMKIETALAKVSKSRAELRDVAANYNKMTIEDFESNYPAIKLSAYMSKLDVDNSCFKELVVGQPDFVSGANKIVESMTADELKAYMEWDVILSAVDYLSDDVIAANFDFFGKTMSGRKENYPRWKRATSQVESQMGEALGKMYVERYFPAAAKARMEKLVENLQISLAQRIREQDWMSEDYYSYDPEKAMQLVEESGYNGEPLVLLSTSSAFASRLGQLIQNYLLAVGINVELNAVDMALYTAIRLDGSQYDMTINTVGGTSLADQWSIRFDPAAYSGGDATGRNDQVLAQMLYDTWTLDGWTKENIDAVHDYIKDNAIAYGLVNPQVFTIWNNNLNMEKVVKGGISGYVMFQACQFDKQ